MCFYWYILKIISFINFSCEYLMTYAGCAVINAAEMGISFPLKKRDLLLDYVLTLMGRDDSDNSVDSSNEHLRTQVCILFSTYRICSSTI